MAQTFGFVVEISDDGRATVVAEKEKGCGSCSSLSQCYGGHATKTQRTQSLNRAGASVGDRVTLTVASGAILARMAVLYLVPVFGMLSGAFTGAFMFDGVDGSNDGHTVLFSLAGFGLGVVISVSISRIWSAARPILPVITRVVNTKFVSPSSNPSMGCGSSGK